MASKAGLEKQDRARDAAFNKAMHGESATAAGGFRAMMAKNNESQKAAVDEYFKHWDNKAAEVETEETRAVCPLQTPAPIHRLPAIYLTRLTPNLLLGAHRRVCHFDETV